jgi:pimeloyl-ACP methyl ester carboxylesterase
VAPARVLHWIAAAMASLLVACATPASRIDALAADYGWERLLLRGTEFTHVAYFKPGHGGTTLHVYVEHDGTPWSTLTTPSRDPTPTRPVALVLMALDRAPSLYLGRPCYFGLAREPPCEPAWWTRLRYSARVVASMKAALESYAADHAAFTAIELYGYSGGGVIAALLAARVPGVTRLVTVAAPLDVEGWTALHGYTALDGSLDPLREPPLDAAIVQLHVAGAVDTVVPPPLVEGFVARQHNARMRTIAGFTHICCWERIWVDDIVLRR